MSSEEALLTIEDFRNSGWQEVVEAKRKDINRNLHSDFLSAASHAEEAGNNRKARCLILLGNACSMLLSPEKYNEPFKPYFEFGDRRSAIPDDFTEKDIELLSQIVKEVDFYWLIARLADLIWHLSRKSEFALLAIDNYTQSPLDIESMVRGGRENWMRAIYLCLNIRKNNGNRLIKIKENLFYNFQTLRASDGYLAIWLAELLFLTKSDKEYEIAKHLEMIGKVFNSANDFRYAEDYFNKAGSWYKRIKNNSEYIRLHILEAEAVTHQGYQRINGEDPSHMVGVHFFERAIQLYKSIPRAERNIYAIDQRITALYKQLIISGENALEELKPIEVTFDITEIVETARAKIQNQSSLECLLILANIYPGIDKKQIFIDAKKNLVQNPLMSLSSSVTFAKDGRVASKNEGIDLRDPDSDQSKEAVAAEALRNYLFTTGTVVQGGIIPVLQELRRKYRFTERDFIEICTGAPILPKGSEVLFARALFAGLENDFVLAIHLLVPQIENLVRYHLKFRDAKTTTLSKDGIRTENGLSTLVELPEMINIFGENITYEIQALFCDSRGPNLRNQLAHGLLNYSDFESASVVYAWWFWFKIVLNNFVNVHLRNYTSTTE